MDREIRGVLNELNKENEEVECPLCELDKSVLKGILEKDIGWSDLPDGWDEESVKSFAKSLTGKDVDEEGFFDKCVDKLKDEEGFDEEGAKKLCASLIDHLKGTTYWRGSSEEEGE